MRSRRRVAAVLVVVLVVAFVCTVVWGITTVADRGDENCARIAKVVETLDTIIASGDEQVRRYVQEGLLTAEQGQRADVEREAARRQLAGADCPPH